MRNKNLTIAVSLFVQLIVMTSFSEAQPAGFNYDEAKVPSFELPDPLLIDSQPIESKQQWLELGRPHLLELFTSHVYGQHGLGEVDCEFQLLEEGSREGCRRKQVEMKFTANGRQHVAQLLLYLPVDTTESVPVFVGLNFQGNHTVDNDPEILLTQNWVQNNKGVGVENNEASENGRGKVSGRWPVDLIVERGYGLATVYYGDIDPDFDDGFNNGVHALLDKSQLEPAKISSIAAWSWGLSRVVDYLETDTDFDAGRIALLGHSRLGKTSLWAGASDERFSIVISNNSGCGGSALHRREFGETVKRINEVFPHWFCEQFSSYDDTVNDCPVDQHMLIALMAPRPAYVASASKDLWADPRGEFLSARHAEPVYNLFGLTGLGDIDFPENDSSIGDFVGYHLRVGKHDVKVFDWKNYLDFADRHFDR